MNSRKIRFLKIIMAICIIILVIEVIYIGYHLTYNDEKSIYFDGINAIEATDKYYITIGSNNDNDNHYEKAKISKYDLKKQKVFEKLYNVGYNSSFFGVTIDDDDFVVVGSYEKEEEDHEKLVRRALIVKYDKDGNVIFENDFNVLDNSKFTSIIKVDDGYLVTGQSIYENTRVGNKDGGAIIAKYDKDGDLIWYKTYGGSKSAIFNDLVVVGNYVYAVGTDENYLGVIVKYDLDGNYIGYNDYKTTDSLGFGGIANIDGFLYVSGALRRDKYNNDAMVVRYNLDCVYIDQVVYVGEGIERFNKIVVDDNDNLVAIGTMAVPKKEKGISEYNYDGIVAKYDKNLKYIDSVSYGDERDDYFTDIKVVDEKYLVVGYSSYEDGSYMSKFISYSSAFKVLGVE